MTKTVVLIGAGGHGKVLAEIAESLGYRVEFYDDHWPSVESNGGWAIKGTLSDYKAAHLRNASAVVAVGDNSARERLQLTLPHINSSLIHPSAVVSPSATVGMGSVVMAGAVINADVKIGQGVIVNTGATIDHDSVIGDFAHISPQVALAGGVRIGRGAWVGIGSCVIQKIKIGAGARVGAGSVVINDIPDGVTAVGNPCKILNK
jgi:sugar O-acyltransferase (sialic acid O-acetyltransferase NeuD family)